MVKQVGTKDEFDQVIKTAGDRLVVVDFYATWCGPCKMIAPKLDKMAEEFKDCIFIKVDVDEIEELVDEYSVNVMPTFVLFRNGQKVDSIEGNNPDGLRAKVEQLRSKS